MKLRNEDRRTDGWEDRRTALLFRNPLVKSTQVLKVRRTVGQQHKRT